MKTITLRLTGIIIMFLVASCAGNDKTKLAKLKHQQSAIS